jgi:hypothetical protein
MRFLHRLCCLAVAPIVVVWGCQKPNPAFDDVSESGETRGLDTLAGDGDGDGDGDASTGDGDGDGDPDAGDGDGDSSTGDGDGEPGDGDGDGDGDPNQCNPGQMLCEGMCVDTQFDNGNCGDCGLPCIGDQLCAYGMCTHPHYIFVTQFKTTGNFGGVAMADAICNEAAQQSQLPVGEYRAWVSEADKSPANTFMTDGVYVLPKGSVVAYSWEDLTSGMLLHPINETEGGEAVLPSPGCNDVEFAVWTATAPNGNAVLPNCENWTQGFDMATGRVGNAQAIDGNWSATECLSPCISVHPFYCVQL